MSRQTLFFFFPWSLSSLCHVNHLFPISLSPFFLLLLFFLTLPLLFFESFFSLFALLPIIPHINVTIHESNEHSYDHGSYGEVGTGINVSTIPLYFLLFFSSIFFFISPYHYPSSNISPSIFALILSIISHFTVTIPPILPLPFLLFLALFLFIFFL